MRGRDAAFAFETAGARFRPLAERPSPRHGCLMKTFTRPLVAALAVCAAGLSCREAAAQGFRVFTTVHDMAGAGEPVRAVTLFHAGKVYDHVDVGGEVIVYEPTQDRFRILNPKRRIVTTAAFGEIQAKLKVAREETAKHAANLSESPDPDAARVAAMLKFQLDPRFEESFDEKTGVLVLDGGLIRYEVRTVDPQRPGIAEAYLDCADWVCRLNYVLHPGPVLPEPRIAVNQALRARGRLPESVELKVMIDPPIHRRAEHTAHFDLNAQDRASIHQWESLLKGDAVREIPLMEYQKVVTLTAKAR